MTSLRVIHESWGEGEILPSTELFDDEGNVYVDIMFDHGIEHEVLVDEGLGDVIRGAAYRTGQAVSLPGRGVRAVGSAINRAKTAVTSAVDRAKTATKRFGKSVGAAYHVGRIGGIRTPWPPAPSGEPDTSTAPAPSAPAPKDKKPTAPPSDPNRLVTSKKKIAPPAKGSNRVSVTTQRGAPAPTTTAAPAPETTKAPAKKAPSNLSQVLNTPKKAPTAPAAASTGSTGTKPPKRGVTPSTAASTKGSSVSFRSATPQNNSYEYDDEDNYIEEGYVYNGESLYEAAAQVKVGPTKTAKGSASGMNTRQTTRKKGGRGLEQDDLQKAPRKGPGRQEGSTEDPSRRHPLAQMKTIADGSIIEYKNHETGEKTEVSRLTAQRAVHHALHVLKTGPEREAFAKALNDNPNHKLRASYIDKEKEEGPGVTRYNASGKKVDTYHAKEEFEQPRMSAYSADSRSFALEHSIRNIISEGRNLRKEAMLSKYGLLEKAESLTKGMKLHRAYHTPDGKRTFKIYHDRDWDDHQVHHYDEKGKHMGEGPVSYHGGGEDGRQDAIDTAEFLLRHHASQKNEEVEHLGERVNTATSIKKIYHSNFDENGHSAIVKYNPQTDKHEVDHMVYGKVKKTTTHGSKSDAIDAAERAMSGDR